jgi:5-methylcytosine-specific restriction enzyme subunit McrC
VNIPIQNVYYLLLYAWRHVQRRELIDRSAASTTELLDLLSSVLADEIGRLISRGLDRDYIAAPDVVRGLRGKLDVGTTVKRNLLADGRTYCHFDDLRHDVPRNRVIKATLRSLLRVDLLDAAVRERVRQLYRKMDAVADVSLARRDFRSIQTHRHVRHYGFALNLCRLILDSLVIDETTGKARFHDFRRDEARMWQLFEEFVREFYGREQKQYRVSRPQIRWHNAEGSDSDLVRLPMMQTDVVLESADRCLIIDTKFYDRALDTGRFGTERLRSGHLYQLFAYLENRTASRPDIVHEGMLLYPVANEPFAHSYRLKGHRIRVRSINLAQPWRQIHTDLLELLD